MLRTDSRNRQRNSIGGCSLLLRFLGRPTSFDSILGFRSKAGTDFFVQQSPISPSQKPVALKLSWGCVYCLVSNDPIDLICQFAVSSGLVSCSRKAIPAVPMEECGWGGCTFPITYFDSLTADPLATRRYKGLGSEVVT